MRCSVPIYVAEDVMKEASFIPESDEQESISPSKTENISLTKLEALRAQLNEAIEREDYEKAAKLRDEIKKLEQ